MKRIQRILVTGTTGFTGSWFMHRLRQDDTVEVRAITRSNGYDLSQPGWHAKLPEQDFDAVVHLASSRHQREFPARAEDLFNVNVGATFYLLEWARRHGVKRFVLASTGSVYAPQQRPLVEDDPCAAPSMYAASKLSAEHLACQYARFFEVKIVRLFCLYGPGQTGRLISDMIQRVERRREIQLAGGIGLWLSPCYIEDGVAALAEVTLQETVAHQVINVAGDEVVSLADVVRYVANHQKATPLLEITEAPPRWMAADITRLKSFYTPTVSLAEGLRRTLDAITGRV